MYCYFVFFGFRFCMNFWLRRVLIGLNLTGYQLNSLQSSCGRKPGFRKMRAGSPVWCFMPNLMCSFKSWEPVRCLLLAKFQDRDNEWRGIPYLKLPSVPQPPTTHLPRILQQFWDTISHVRIHSSQKQNIVIPEITSEANLSHSLLFLYCKHGKGQFYKLRKFIEN